ncbi:hypothetical protein [Acaryochloris thomasi]|uniref:hypothetical protein n=1 Tax=Acaryochloris thomasi TaxID=2929456 RepID=UPI000DA660B2|nr:hypothetical protein [Acaryochloris thomasi]
MGTASRYWQLVRIDASGQRRVDRIQTAYDFFQEVFGSQVQVDQVADATVQSKLIQFWKTTQNSSPAEWCLRCFISNVIDQACGQLETQFGRHHGFSRYDLFPFVLNDSYPPPRQFQGNYQSLASQILQTFKPENGSLVTWTVRRVRCDRNLNKFLLEHGIYLVSDWAILNDTSLQQVERILSEFHSATASEIKQAMDLLSRYHAVYRRDRIQRRQAGLKGRCSEPTANQLSQIAGSATEAGVILAQLQSLAGQLRRYRIHARGGPAPTTSLDQPTNEKGQLPQLAAPVPDQAEDEQNAFLTRYREQFRLSLDEAIGQILRKQLESRKPRTAEQFLQALYLFHCRGQSMTEIAPQVNLKAQYQVSRLLKLKDLRADIRRQVLLDLRDRVLQQAKVYADPNRLQQLNGQLDTVLEEQVEEVIQEAAAEASVPRNRPIRSLYARRLCQDLDQRIEK